MVATIACCIFMIIISKDLVFIIYMLIMITIVLGITVIVILNYIKNKKMINEKQKIIKEKLWKNGLKTEGAIVDVGNILYRRTKSGGHEYRNSKLQPYSGFVPLHNTEPIDYFITIAYDNLQKCVDIRNVKNNKVYKLISILLDPYPIKTDVKIPIDVYIYNNDVYPDLDSIDFSKIKGYQDAIKIINEEKVTVQ